MNRTHAYVGPRGWAVLTLAGGAALASPFLRPPHLDSARLESPTSNAASFAGGTVSSNAFDVSLSSAQVLPVRVVSGVLPTTVSKLDEFVETSTPEFPAWVKPPSPLDDLIARGTAPIESASTVETSPAQGVVHLQPLRSWQGDGLPSSTPADLAGQALPAQSWPDQTLGHAPSPLLAQERTGRRHVARGLGTAQPHSSEHQLTVAVPLTSTALGNGAAPSIGATLSRSNLSGTQPRGGHTVANPQVAPSRPGAAYTVNENRFVYQPGLKKP